MRPLLDPLASSLTPVIPDLFTLYPAVPAPFLPTTGHAQGRHWGRHGQRVLAGGKNQE